MAACVLALLVVAPTVSMATCICNDDAAIASVDTGVTTAHAVEGDRQDHGAPCEAACCVSGHCHHGGAMLDAPVAVVPAPAPIASEHATASAHVLASRTISGPDRPPRA
jgi:hypothetical protein